MITVEPAVRSYCKENNLPDPEVKDFEHCGRMVSHHFKKFWAIHLPEGVIQGSGFVKVITPSGAQVIQAYPPEFEPEMKKRINVYFSSKNIACTTENNLPDKEPVKKLRKRTPIKTPAASFKPSKVGG